MCQQKVTPFGNCTCEHKGQCASCILRRQAAEQNAMAQRLAAVRQLLRKQNALRRFHEDHPFCKIFISGFGDFEEVVHKFALFILISTIMLFYLGFALFCNVIPVPATPITESTKWIDMSYTFNEDTIHHPLNGPFEMRIYNGSIEGFWFQGEEITTNTHAGTHMDSPCHFVPGRWTVDEIPPDHLLGLPAAVIDVSEQARIDPDSSLEIADLQRWEEKHGPIPKGAVLIMNTGHAEFVNDPNRYFGIKENSTELHFLGLAPSAAQWLVDNKDVYGIGTDTASIDTAQRKDAYSHVIVGDKNIYPLENLANVNSLPSIGATLYVLPMKIGKACGAPCRVFASVKELTASSERDSE